MGIFLAALLILSLPAAASAHPGKTDRVGGHKCWKDCGEWELYYGEYHLHDKDYKPIRVENRSAPVASPEKKTLPAAPTYETSDTVPADNNKQPEVKTEAPRPQTNSSVVYEENIFPFDPYLLLLAAALLLLLLAVLLLVRRKREL